MSLFQGLLKFPGSSSLLGWLTRFDSSPLAIKCLGLDFPNCLGLAAGFDKAACWYPALAKLGFGHIEVGTITAHPQEGNPTPRLFRLVRDQALLNRMGFNNPGAAAVANNLARQPKPMVLGVNIGKSKITDNEHAIEDYAASFERLFPYADYFVVNVSSPNTPHLRELQDRQPLLKLLTRLTELSGQLAQQSSSSVRPIVLKIAPDLTHDQLNDIAEIALQVKLAGIIATNTTIRRDNLRTSDRQLSQLGSGGISGKPLTHRSREIVRYLFNRLRGQIPLISSGGIMSGADAWESICAGASLVQLYTGFVYGGPFFVAQVARHLTRKLELLKIDQISQAVGRNA